MGKQKRKVIHVELYHDNKMNDHLYFGSVAAIYDHLTIEQLGISKEALWNALRYGTYKGKKATVRQSCIIAKDTHRGIR